MLPCNRKNASDIWSMMTKTGPGLAKCNICGQEFKADKRTSNMLRHVKAKHSTGSEQSRAQSQPGPSTSGSNPPSQLTLVSAINRVTKYRPESEKKKAIDQKLLGMIYKDMQPFRIVDDIGFREYSKELDPRYELPSRTQLKRRLPMLYDQVTENLVKTLSNVEHISITTDSWTSINMESFLTVTAHFLEPSPSWKLQSTVLATRQLDKDNLGSSAEGMAEVIFEVLEDFNIKDKLCAATTDSASSMVALVRDHLKVRHVRCFAHTLNLIVKDAMKATVELQPLIETVKTIVNHFHKSSKATVKLKTTLADLNMKELKLSQDVETRWNSTLKMLRRYCELHRAVSGALMALGKTELVISDQKVEDIKMFCESLEPFEEATEMMSTEKRTSLSMILVVVRQLQHFLKNETTQSVLTDNLLRQISLRFPNPEESFSGAAATLLDPHFKRVSFSDGDLRKGHESRIVDQLKPHFTSGGGEKETEATRDDTPQPPKRSFMQSFFGKYRKLRKLHHKD